MRTILQLFLSVTLVLVMGGCGDDSLPPLWPEVRYEVESAEGGAATFKVLSMSGGSIEYNSLADTSLSSRSTFNLFLENSPPPYTLKIEQVGDTPLRVLASASCAGRACIFDTQIDCPAAALDNPQGCAVDAKVMTITLGGEPESSLRADSPEIRFDLCSPVLDATCLNNFADSTSGIDFTGSMGDQEVTYVLNRPNVNFSPLTTPAIYFFQAAEHNISGAFRSGNDQFLRADLYVNQNLVDKDVERSDDVTVRDDL